MVIIAGVAVWQSTKPIETVGKPVDRVLAMPTGPSIAVLPFDNLSGDPEQEYFSDGLTEDLITELARFKDLRVLARNTTFQYKGKAIDITQLGRDLGVGYVVEGSVRRAGDRIRINIQLIDAQSGDHLWADKFDREFKDVFDLQDEITATVVGVIASGRGGVLQRAERAQARGKRTEDMRAYDYLLQARVNVVFSRDEHEQRKALLLKALDLDPDYARAREEYAWLLMMGWVFRFEDSPEPPAALKENAIRSVELDPSDAHAQRTAAYGYFFDKQLDRFKQHADLALELAPNNAEILVQMGMAYSFIGDSDRGLRLAEKSYS